MFLIIRYRLHFHDRKLTAVQNNVLHILPIHKINNVLILQSRAQGLLKNLHDTHEQIEQTAVELNTFKNLRQHEIGAIPKRLEVRCISVVGRPSRLIFQTATQIFNNWETTKIVCGNCIVKCVFC